MTRYVCSSCKKPQYTADTKFEGPCIYCGHNKVRKEDGN